MTVLLNLMWGSISTSASLPAMVPENQVDSFIQLAAKYDVSALIHNIYTVLIVRIGHESTDNQFSALRYAITYGDPWLTGFILSGSTLPDPLHWSRDHIDLLGKDAYIDLIKAYPRGADDSTTTSAWKIASDKMDWSQHNDK